MICKNCGKVSKPLTPRKKFCSKTCSIEFHNKLKLRHLKVTRIVESVVRVKSGLDKIKRRHPEYNLEGMYVALNAIIKEIENY